MTSPPAPELRTGAQVDASVRLAPPVLHSGSRTTLAIIELPTRADVSAVATSTVRVLADGEWVALDDVRAEAGSRLLVTFDASQLRDRLGAYTGTVELTVTGHLADGRSFAGEAAVRLR